MSRLANVDMNEDFLNALFRGSELIGEGAYEEAKVILDEALVSRPDDPKARNLLGLAHFKLGDYEMAESIYMVLVDENPRDATLRVNLGLVHLKTGMFEDAITELEVAVELRPGHRRAQNYLGVAYARVGDYVQAQACFAAAGSEEMVERMDQLLVGEDPGAVRREAPPEEAGEPAAEAVEQAAEAESDFGWEDAGADPEAAPLEDPLFNEYSFEDPDLVDESGLSEESAAVEHPAPEEEEDAWREHETEESVAAEDQAPEDDIPLEEESAAVEHPASEEEEDAWREHETEEPVAAEDQALEDDIPVEEQPTEDPTAMEEQSNESPPAIAEQEAEEHLPAGEEVVASAPSHLLDLAEPSSASEEAEGTFLVGTKSVTVFVRGEVFSRTRALLALEGTVDLQPEEKRYRGQPTGKAFGDGEDLMMRLTGEGRLYLAVQGRCFTPVAIDGVDAYFREEVVCGFDGSVAFENGRVPSDYSTDLNLVFMRGEGSVLLETGGTIVSSAVKAGQPVRVPMSRLVGWTGHLRPSVVAFPGGERSAGQAPMPFVELDGEGVAFTSLP